ncbi:hypothetical protein IHE45_14G050600 [Dioscorea alata]|uniref:Uncharacterized protein n=1 Tax=Dioscorea alata TaxID=55571 RepID=A0ACB7URT9_DIOAL|nr:hypothetical protein IHE45_14G050600 [Dioscorea alata]
MLKLSGWPRLTWGRGARAAGGGRSSPPTSRVGPCNPSVARRVPTRVEGARRPRELGASPVQRSSRPAPHRGRAGAGLRPAARRGASLRVRARARAGATRSRDAQAGVPSTGWPRAQLVFKDSMVHGILQFTPSIAFRYVLHRCESRDIRCRESCDSCVVSFLRAGARRPGGAAARSEGRDVLGASLAGCGVMSSRPFRGGAACGGAEGRRGTQAYGRGDAALARARPPRSPRPGRAPRFRVFSGLPRVCGGSRQ